MFQSPLRFSLTVSVSYTFQSRPALSLLAYCYYQLPDYVKAADCYEQLTQLYPSEDAYRPVLLSIR